MAFKRMKPARPAASAPVDAQIYSGLRKAVELMERRQLDEAYELAESLHSRFPNRQEPLLFMMDLAKTTEDIDALEDALEPLLKIAPNNPEFALVHAQIAATNELVALSLERFTVFLARWPEHKE